MLKKNKLPDDFFFSVVLKEYKDVLSGPVIYISQMSMYSDNLPILWKKANVMRQLCVHIVHLA